MGVPKFFRYISERYPCLSELVKEHQIPEFDNLYLDMNGIIHVCSHPDDFDAHFRITEEKIFTDIFHYIEMLFGMIKPQKLFFMAVDGVAPRAKMNQQRGRRFRMAKDSETLEAKARERGEELPKEARFDSNCITPGTVFMARLHEQLKYFVTQKVSTNKLWQKCKIILSGHETPGEGEHKIMEYIRYMRAQPGYNPNTRHCLYGLDADLIILGLCTHEPHFSLLREEVRFGKKAKRKYIPEHMNFYLLHLSLMREYLELEFFPLKDSLPFQYDMEKIIDDWVLMGFLVGNDFIPNLPNLHIGNGALPILYNAYMKILPTLDGYINEAGILNLNRFEKFMSALALVDISYFSEQFADLLYFHSKTGRKMNNKERTSYKPKQLEAWNDAVNCDNVVSNTNSAEIKTTNKELEALIKSTDYLLLDDSFLKTDSTDNKTELKLVSEPEIIATIPTDQMLLTESESSNNNTSETKLSTNSDSSLQNSEVQTDMKHSTPKSILEPSESNLENLALDLENQNDYEEDSISPYLSETDSYTNDELIHAEFIQHKNNYYMEKLNYIQVTPEVMHEQAETYVRAIQWNLHYYYNGVCSWSWYYPHHYAPYISDIKGFSGLKLEYNLGDPFKPFEQLLAVLPAFSKLLLPEPYHELMTSEDSTIINFYPTDFLTDLNGKRQDWEAVVLIPFIEEDLLLKAMAPCNKILTEEEIKRNTHGPMLVYEYTSEELGVYTAPEYFSVVEMNHARVKEVFIKDLRVPIEKLIKGPYPGSVHDVYYPGFPTLKHLKYTGELKKAKVRVFDQPSQNDNMIVKITPLKEKIDVEKIAKELLGRAVHVSWPHLVEAYVTCVSDYKCRYHSTVVPGKFNLQVNKKNLEQKWVLERDGIVTHYMEKYGIDVGDTTVLIHVKILIGIKYSFTQLGLIEVEKQWANVESRYPLQSVVRKLVVAETGDHPKTVQDLYPVECKCFMIGHPEYGSMGEVLDNTLLKHGRIKVSMLREEEPDLTLIHQMDIDDRYLHGSTAAQQIGIISHLLSRITGSIFAIPGVKIDSSPPDRSTRKINIGLNLKLNKRNEEIPGYTRKIDGQWLYSPKAVELVQDYLDFCPMLFHHIKGHMGNDMFYESELFPDDVGNGKLQEIADWIKKQPFSSVERQKIGTDTADSAVVEKIEKIIDEFNKTKPSPKQIVMQVKPHLLYKSDVQSSYLPPDSAAVYELYDRVVSVRDNCIVPLGHRGTVIGIYTNSVLDNPNNESDTMDEVYEVLFDQSFPSGLRVQNSAGSRRYRLPKSGLINLSHGCRVVQQKIVKPVTNNFGFNKAVSVPNHRPSVNVANPVPVPVNWSQPQMFRAPPPTQMFMRPPPPPPQQQFMHSMAYHQRLSAPQHFTQPHKQQQQSYKTEASHEFQAFLQDIQKNQAKEQSKQAKRPSANLAQEQKSVQRKQTKDTSHETNALKKLLNISRNDSPEKGPSTSAEPAIVRDSQPISVQDFFAHARTKEQKLYESNASSQQQQSYYTQLLNYCQTQRIGIPRYSYFPSVNNKIQAQIMLQDGRNAIGDEALTKEEATENAAKMIMNDIQQASNDTSMKQQHKQSFNATNLSPKGFPPPPKQWYQDPNATKTYKSNEKVAGNVNKATNEFGERFIVRKDMTRTNGNRPASNAFVPLQAVKQQQRSKSSTNHSSESASTNVKSIKNDFISNVMVGNVNTENNHSNKNKLLTDVEKVTAQESHTTNSAPKKKEKRSRIAANFSGLQKQNK